MNNDEPTRDWFVAISVAVAFLIFVVVLVWLMWE